MGAKEKFQQLMDELIQEGKLYPCPVCGEIRDAGLCLVCECVFINSVLRKLPERIHNNQFLIDLIGKLFDCEFSLEDAISYMRCTEEVSPFLDEDLALSRMKKISSKYPKYAQKK